MRVLDYFNDLVRNQRYVKIYTDLGPRLYTRREMSSVDIQMWWKAPKVLQHNGFSTKKEGKCIYLTHWKEGWDIDLPPVGLYEMKNVKGCLKYQPRHISRLLRALDMNNAAFDGSDTGTGKTYTAMAVARELGLNIVVICPKTVISSWYEAAQDMKVFHRISSITNYELITRNKILVRRPKRGGGMKLVPIDSPYSDYIPSNRYGNRYIFRHYPNILFIIDEAQRCKNYQTKNAQMLIGLRKAKNKILILSATLAEKLINMYATGYAIGLFPALSNFYKWMQYYQTINGQFVGNNELSMKKVHEDIFPSYGSRMRIRELGDMFPKNKIIANSFDMGVNSKKIQRIYQELIDDIERLEEEEATTVHILARISKARQLVEMLKIPTLVELAKDHMGKGYSIAIFVNFKNTLKKLSERLKVDCIVQGGQSKDMRTINIRRFKRNKDPIILLNIASGGVGISLHDPIHKKPRISLISPSFSAIKLKQAIGRIWRANGGPAINKIVFCADTIEDEICKSVKKKIGQIDLLNDGDFTTVLGV